MKLSHLHFKRNTVIMVTNPSVLCPIDPFYLTPSTSASARDMAPPSCLRLPSSGFTAAVKVLYSGLSEKKEEKPRLNGVKL
jgi:hypothetical protein